MLNFKPGKLYKPILDANSYAGTHVYYADALQDQNGDFLPPGAILLFLEKIRQETKEEIRTGFKFLYNNKIIVIYDYQSWGPQSLEEIE